MIERFIIAIVLAKRVDGVVFLNLFHLVLILN